MKKTVVVGASSRPYRYSRMAVERLQESGHEVVAVGLRGEQSIGDIPIHGDMPEISDVDTVTLYVGPRNQPYWTDYIRSLHPKRVIFNPGTENPDFMEALEKDGVEVVEGCTLVMLSVKTY